MNAPDLDLSDDRQAIPEIAAIEAQVMGMSVEAFSKLSDRIHRYQPILISSALGYRADGLSMNAVGGMLQVYGMMWLRFEHEPQIKKKKITVRMLDQSGVRNAAFLKYWGGEESAIASTETLKQHLSQVREKTLFAYMIRHVLEGDAFRQVDLDEKHQLIFDLKCILDCLEEIAGKRD